MKKKTTIQRKLLSIFTILYHSIHIKGYVLDFFKFENKKKTTRISNLAHFIQY